MSEKMYPIPFKSLMNWVVTEYGAVLIKGQSVKKRSEALISIAHPDFRDQLRFEAKKMGLLR